jgi:hypothetical protein
MCRAVRIFFTLGFLCQLLAAPANARVRRLLDFDGTIVDDQSETSTWRTYWLLIRVDQLHSVMQPMPMSSGAPATIRISYREYLKYMKHLARDEIFNLLETVPLEDDPLLKGRRREFVPGFYRVDPAQTFKYYRPATDQKNKSYIINDYNHAKTRTAIMTARDDGKVYDWRGPAWRLFQAGMSDPSTVGDTKIFSSRWHTPQEVEALMQLWKADGEIGFTNGFDIRGRPTQLTFYSLSAPESRLYSRDPSELAARKAQIVRDEATALLHAPFVPGDESHTLIVAEDEPRYVDAVAVALRELSSSPGFVHQMKFVLFNTTVHPSDLASARYKWPYTVFERGTARPATSQEIQEWEAPSSAWTPPTKMSETHDASLAGVCNSAFNPSLGDRN